MVGDSVDILAISETKIDDSFTKAQAEAPGFNKPYRLDVTKNSGGILVYVRRGIFSRPIKLNPFPSDIQLIVIELRFGQEKWAFVSIYRPPTTQTLSYFLEHIDNLSLIHI